MGQAVGEDKMTTIKMRCPFSSQFKRIACGWFLLGVFGLLILAVIDPAKCATGNAIDVDSASTSPTSKNPALDQPLLDAAKAGDMVKVGLLLAQGADPNASDKYHNSALALALKAGKDDAAQLLIRQGADGSVENAIGENAAWTASESYYCPGALKLLLTKGVKVTGRNKQGLTILGSMTWYTPPELGFGAYVRAEPWSASEFKAYEKREHRTVDLLAATGIGLNERNGPNLETPLMSALYYPGHYEAARALIEHGAGITLKDGMGNTALYYFFERSGQELIPLPLDLLKTLLKGGCDPNGFYFEGGHEFFPILEEAIYGSEHSPKTTTLIIKRIRLLLDYGADPLLKDFAGGSALSVAKERYPELVPILEASAKKRTAP